MNHLFEAWNTISFKGRVDLFFSLKVDPWVREKARDLDSLNTNERKFYDFYVNDFFVLDLSDMNKTANSAQLPLEFQMRFMNEIFYDDPEYQELKNDYQELIGLPVASLMSVTFPEDKSPSKFKP